MAIPSSLLSLRFLTASTPTSTRDGHPNLPVLHVSAPANRRSPLHLRSRSMSSRRTHRLINAIEGGEQDTESGTENSEQNSSSEPETGDATPSGSNLTELGSEIKEALKAKKEMEGDKEGNLWSGVAEEIREIEWPAFGKVLGTTGVVLGVIAGSSLVLLTVNAVLAELSDRVFAGKGVQDFFG